MRQARVPVQFFGVLFLIALAGCANPATDKPEAAVSEPEAAPTETAAGEKYVFGEGSTIGFVGSKVTGSHDGGFHSFDGEIVLVNGDPTMSKVSVVIDTTSLWADDDRLAGHLKSPDFLNAEAIPTASFTSTSIAKDGEEYSITGNLNLHGVEKSITFPASISVEEGGITVAAEFFIRRFDFDIVYPGKPDDLIRDEVVIKLDLRAQPAG